jgi:DNA-binding response OmpR family regulator
MFDDEIGAENVIMKPFDADTLLERIEGHIGKPE